MGTFALRSSVMDRRIEAVLTGLTPVPVKSLAPVKAEGSK
jgi:hypothetical protein